MHSLIPVFLIVSVPITRQYIRLCFIKIFLFGTYAIIFGELFLSIKLQIKRLIYNRFIKLL